MSTKAVAIALVVTLVLVGAVLLLNLRGGVVQVPVGGAAVATFRAGDVEAITAVRAGGREEKVVRRGSGEWVYVAGEVEWPAVPPETVGAALAALGGELTKRAEGVVAEGGATVVLGMRGGAAWRLNLAGTSLGGRTAARVEGPGGESWALIENSVLDPLVNPGPAGWRVREALPGAEGASRVTVEEGGNAVSLAKIEGTWVMRRPIAAAASEGAVATLLRALGEVRVVRFEDGKADAGAMGLTKPVLSVRVERDVREGEAGGAVRVRAVGRELVVGGPADAKGDTRFAAVDRAGTMVMVVGAGAVNAVSASARLYLHPTVTRVAPGEVAMVVISDESGGQRGYRRDGGGWVRMEGDGTRSVVEGGPVEDLLEFLHARPGEPEPMGPEDGIRGLRRVELLDAEGDAREVLTAGYTADGQFAVRSGNLLVTFRSGDAPAILDLPAWETLPAEEEAVVPKMPEGAPTGK